MKIINIFVLLIDAICILGKDGITVRPTLKTTYPPTNSIIAKTNPTTTPPTTTTTISTYEFKYDLEQKVAKIRSGVTKQVAEVIRFENLRHNVLSDVSELEKFKLVVAEYDKQYANDLEIKILLDEVKCELNWAINAYTDIGLRITRSLCSK